MDTIRVGVVGAGTNTVAKHIPELQAIEGVEIVSVCNRSPESSQRIAKQFGIPTTYKTWADLIEADDTDAIVVGTWPYLHCATTLSALASGKHILCEARMAMNLEEAQLMHDAAQSNPDLIAQIVPSPMTLWADKTIQRLIKEGYTGDILSVEVRASGSDFIDKDSPIHWRNNYDLSGMNIMSMGIWYEAMRRWVGDPLRIFAQGKTFTKMRKDNDTGVMRAIRVPEHIDILMDLICGAQGYLKVSTVQGLANENTATIYGSEGTIRMEDGKLYGAQRGETTLNEITIRPEDHAEWRVEQEFVNAIRGIEKITHTPFDIGVKYMEFTEAVNQSMAEGKAISIPL
tara:strand:+ start:13477 stop:14508 length:1032 start_codon:yes stop_codon:yes gene_type:complete